MFGIGGGFGIEIGGRQSVVIDGGIPVGMLGGLEVEYAVSGVLNRWEWDFNVHHQFPGFPNFGKTAMQRVIDYERAYQS